MGFLLDAAAGVRGAAFEEVDAVGDGGDEGDGGFGEGVAFAEEGDYGGFAEGVGGGFLFGIVVVVVVVAVLVLIFVVLIFIFVFVGIFVLVGEPVAF